MGSLKRSGAGKITLGMLKGKPITTSVPTISFRFNTEDEELEELHTSPEEPEQSELRVEDSSSRCSTPQHQASSRDHSPMKEQLQKWTKRSASLDENPPGSSDTWRLLHELKGKITKTVEEKLSEIKNEKKKSSKLVSSKDNSSISDSEECVPADKPEDGSPSHRSTVPTTPESLTPEPEPVQMDVPKLEITEPTITPPTSSPKKNFFKAAESSLRNKIRPKLSELRQRRKKTGSAESSVSLLGLEGQQTEEYDEEFEVIDEEGVESALEVQEEENNILQPVMPKKQPIKKQWSVMSHVRELCAYREVQVLLGWAVLCCVVSVPASVRDVVLGALVMHAAHRAYQWLLRPGPPTPEPLQLPDYGSLPILEVPAAREYQPLQSYEGWMNELPDDYDPETYHINQTRSVFLRLEGSTLRISLTRQKVRTRAMWNEPPPRLSFYHQRIFDITGCPINLLPEGLARKRLWSKKYPICVALKPDSRVGISMPETFRDVIEEGEEGSYDAAERGEEENSEDDAFYLVTSSMVEQNQLFLFARTDREKDDWLRRLVAASKLNATPEEVEVETPQQQPESEELDVSSAGSASPEPAVTGPSPEAELQRHISRFLQQVHTRWTPPWRNSAQARLGTKPPAQAKPSGSAASSTTGSPVKTRATLTESEDKNKTRATPAESEENISAPPPLAETAWFNALLSRVLFDVLRDPQWSEWVQDRIQRKISTIKLPTFMEELTVSHLDLGVALPVVHRTSAPHLDERGLWVDLDVSYEGSASISVETKLNLVKLTKGDSVESSSSSNRETLSVPETKPVSRSPIFDSDMEDSAESSSDDDTQEASADDLCASPSNSGGSMGKMLVRMATKITTSRYFQQASEIRYIRRYMEEVSNTRVMVTIELKGLVGVLALNIPPPPSDRIWYGFRGNPELRLAARAKVGERHVTLSQVTDWIEGKLCVEFQKVFVLPNMDELIVPVMNGKLPK